MFRAGRRHIHPSVLAHKDGQDGGFDNIAHPAVAAVGNNESLWGEHRTQSREGMIGHIVQDDIIARCALGEIFPGVIDYVFGAD